MVLATTRMLGQLSLRALARPQALASRSWPLAPSSRGLAILARAGQLPTSRSAAVQRTPMISLIQAREQQSAGLRIRLPKRKYPVKRGRGRQVKHARAGSNYTPKCKKVDAPEKVKFKPHKGLLKRVKILKDDNGRIIFKRWQNYSTTHMYGMSMGQRRRLRKPVYVKSGSQNRLFRKLLGLGL